MNDFDIIIRIGVQAMTEDEALDCYKDILFFIQDNLPLDNYKIDVVKVGEYVE